MRDSRKLAWIIAGVFALAALANISIIANQLESKGLRWKGYMEDMGNIESRESATCGHPALGDKDNTQKAVFGDQYASRHNPFVYFHFPSSTCRLVQRM